MLTVDGEAGEKGKKWRRRTRNLACPAESEKESLYEKAELEARAAA
jgi:hypothetical protein